MNMNELVKLRQQINEMEKQAAELLKKNRPLVLADLREQMAAYGITAPELSRSAPKARQSSNAPAKAGDSAKGKKSSKPASRSPIKYRSADGQEWTGRGTTPKWLKDLMVDGKTKEDFQVSKVSPE